MLERSRREFAGFLLALFLGPRRLSSQPTGDRPVAAASGSAFRAYRVDAAILFLGVSVYRRAGVGGGQASLEETGEGESLRSTYFFAGGSDPRRARGLSRLGWMRETVRGPSGTPSEASYFGVLTASPEESLEHARKSTASLPSASATFSAVSGRNTAGHSRSAVTHFEHSTAAIWSDRSLIEQARSTFGPNVEWRQTSWPDLPDQAPPTFLQLVASLLKQRTRRAAGRYVYSEQEYQLELEAQTPEGDRLLPVRGKIRNLRTGRETPFRVWLEGASESILPVRIEFQPRGFLRLTFEAVSASS